MGIFSKVDVELKDDEFIYLVPMGKKEYAQFKFRPYSRMDELLNEYKIPYKKSKKVFKRVKLIDAERTDLEDYKVKRNNVDGKSDYYYFSFASNVIDKVLDYYKVPYDKSNRITRDLKEKETDIEMNYKTKQAKAKLDNWYICHKLGIKYDTWCNTRWGNRNLAKNKLDQFLELVDPARKEWLEQDSEKKKINAWYKERHNKLDSVFNEFKVTGRQVAADLGVDNGVVSNVKRGKGDNLQAKYLLYYYFTDENNRRNKEITKKGRRGRPAVKDPNYNEHKSIIEGMLLNSKAVASTEMLKLAKERGIVTRDLLKIKKELNIKDVQKNRHHYWYIGNAPVFADSEPVKEKPIIIEEKPLVKEENKTAMKKVLEEDNKFMERIREYSESVAENNKVLEKTIECQNVTLYAIKALQEKNEKKEKEIKELKAELARYRYFTDLAIKVNNDQNLA